MMSQTTSESVWALRLVVPGNACPPPERGCDLYPYGRVGATTPPTSRATRSHTPVGKITSTPSGRCGPCCSVAPTGRKNGARAFVFASNSGQLSSAMKTLSTKICLLLHGGAAVDAQAMAGDEACAGARQKQDRGRNLLGASDPLERISQLPP